MKSDHDRFAPAAEASSVRGYAKPQTFTERFMLSIKFPADAIDRELLLLAAKSDRLNAKYEAASARAKRIADRERYWRYQESVVDPRLSAADAVLGEVANVHATTLAALRLKAQMIERSAETQSAAVEAEHAEHNNDRLLWSLIRDLLAMTEAAPPNESPRARFAECLMRLPQGQIEDMPAPQH